tara:strand:- start:391 stop:957 length:567 start_codon:yes stop_codon:yes gene_type:complete
MAKLSKSNYTYDGETFEIGSDTARVIYAASQDTSIGTQYKVPVVSITAATYAVTTEQSGTIFTLNKADGIVVTLPAATAGLKYEFYVETALTSNNYTVNSAGTGDTLTGFLRLIDIATLGSHIDNNDNVITTGVSIPAAADHQLVTNKTTTGGLAGSHWVYTCITDALWQVSGTNICSSGATLATPFT